MYVVARVLFSFVLICAAYVTAMLIIGRYFFKPNWARLFSKIEDPRGMLLALRMCPIVDINNCTTCPKCRGGRIEVHGWHLSEDTGDYDSGNYIDSYQEAVGYVGIVDLECEDCRHRWVVDSNPRSVQDY